MAFHVADANGWNALHLAVKNSSLELVKAILDVKDIDQCARTLNGSNALHLSIEFGAFDVFKHLLTNLKCPLNDANGFGLVHRAAMHGRLEILREIVRQKGGESAETKNGAIALHIACQYGHFEVAKYLADSGCINKRDHNNWTPLHFAAKMGHFEIVKILSAIPSIDFHATTKDGKTALDLTESAKIKEFLGGGNGNEDNTKLNSSAHRISFTVLSFFLLFLGLFQ